MSVAKFGYGVMSHSHDRRVLIGKRVLGIVECAEVVVEGRYVCHIRHLRLEMGMGKHVEYDTFPDDVQGSAS